MAKTCLATDVHSKWLASKMDLHRENVADNDRYAFLLGFALKNDDSEQFFCIYDNIIPKDLPDSQVRETFFGEYVVKNEFHHVNVNVLKNSKKTRIIQVCRSPGIKGSRCFVFVAFAYCG